MLYNRPVLKSRRKELRNNSTPAEIKLWSMLQHSNLGGYNSGGNTVLGHTSWIFTVLLKDWQSNWTEIHILLTIRLSMIV